MILTSTEDKRFKRIISFQHKSCAFSHQLQKKINFFNKMKQTNIF